MNLKAKSWSSSLWCSIAKSCPTLYDSMDCSMPGFPVLHYLPEFAQVHVHWFGDAIEPSYLLFPSSPFTFNLSQHQSLSIESAFCIRCPKHWSFSFSISPSSECSGSISFRIGWFDLHAIQGTLRSLFQHHSLKASILQHSAFFMVQLSHPYMTIGETIALTMQTFVGKVMSLLFNMLSLFAIAFLPIRKYLLISWLQHHLQWFWSPRKENLSLLLLSPFLFAMKWWERMSRS